MNRKTIGGGALVIAGAFVGRETLVWAFNKVLDALSAGVRGGVSFVSLSWQNGVALALIAVGLIFVVWPKAKAPAQTEDFSYLYNGAVGIINRVRHHRTAKWYRRDDLEPVDAISRAGDAVLLSFSKAGFSIPTLNVAYFEQAAVGQEAYFSELIQLLGRGHIDEARVASIAASERAQSLAAAFKPENWLQQPY